MDHKPESESNSNLVFWIRFKSNPNHILHWKIIHVKSDLIPNRIRILIRIRIQTQISFFEFGLKSNSNRKLHLKIVNMDSDLSKFESWVRIRIWVKLKYHFLNLGSNQIRIINFIWNSSHGFGSHSRSESEFEFETESELNSNLFFF